MKKRNFLTAAICAAVLLWSFCIPAYAFSGEETTGGYDPAEDLEIEPLEPESNPLTPDGTGTMENHATDEDGKEFYTITTADEAVFYLVIDRQRSSENVYFLNAVTVADLAALAELPAETATSSEPEKAPEPEDNEPQETEPEPMKPEKGSNQQTLLLGLAVAVLGGSGAFYFKVYRPKHQRASAPDEDLEEELEENDGLEGYDELEDGPPWDEEEKEEKEE